MKTTTLIIAALLPFFASAQITLEKSYFNIGTVTVHNIEDYGYKYMVVEASKLKISLFNTDHSLWKTIHYNIPAGYKLSHAYTPTSKLFDLDSEVEVILTFGSDTGIKYTTHIVNENGSVLQFFDDASTVYPVKVGSDWKAIVHKYTNHSFSEVYSLPGQQVFITTPGNGGDAELSMYPNPMHEAATLEYSLPSGTTSGQLQVYNASGSLVRSYNVTNQFSSIIIHRGDLPPGGYIYSLQASGTTPVSKSFIIR